MMVGLGNGRWWGRGVCGGRKESWGWSTEWVRSTPGWSNRQPRMWQEAKHKWISLSMNRWPKQDQKDSKISTGPQISFLLNVQVVWEGHWLSQACWSKWWAAWWRWTGGLQSAQRWCLTWFWFPIGQGLVLCQKQHLDLCLLSIVSSQGLLVTCPNSGYLTILNSFKVHQGKPQTQI